MVGAELLHVIIGEGEDWRTSPLSAITEIKHKRTSKL